MPTLTFARLPAARRDRLITAAIAEFAERSYTEASLSRIARRSRIAKGSFYQYFEDKLDLYRYLLGDEAARRKRAFIGAIDFGGEFWTAFEQFVEHGYDKAMGARPMARLVQSTLKAPLANEILFGKLAHGGIARIDVQDGAIDIRCEPARADETSN